MTPTLQFLTARAWALVQRLKPESASSRNVLKLAGGTAGSQLITVAAAPILTRLYGPESFGVLATFSSLLGLIAVVCSLSYEIAIAVPEDEAEAIALVWLCFGLVAITTSLTVLGVVLLGDQLVDWLNEPRLNPLLWLLPVGVLLSGLYQPLSYWAIRRKQFGLLAQTKLRQSIFGVATQIAAAPLGTIGILIGQIVTQSAGFFAIFRKSGHLLLRPAITPFTLVKTLRHYSHFGIYSSLAGLINAISNQLPTLIFASLFGASQLGQLSLAQRLLLLPAGLIGTSVGQVFLSQAAECYREGTLLALIRRVSRKLLLYGLVVAAAATFVVAPLMPLIFGQQWEPTRSIIPILIPLFLGKIVVSPISMAFIATQANKSELFAQACLMLLVVISLIASSLLGLGFNTALAIYSLACLLGYVAYGFLLLKSVSTSW
jgi:O-antigen/teichoic acid export membrane protein